MTFCQFTISSHYFWVGATAYPPKIDDLTWCIQNQVNDFLGNPYFRLHNIFNTLIMSLLFLFRSEGTAETANILSATGKSKTKKIMYDLSENDDFDREEIATYEEVARLFPRPGIFRPIVLIGPPGVGRNELKRRLIALDPERYKATVPRTYHRHG